MPRKVLSAAAILAVLAVAAVYAVLVRGEAERPAPAELGQPQLSAIDAPGAARTLPGPIWCNGERVAG